MAPKKYTLTEAHRATLAPWAEQWIANAVRTDPLTPADVEEIRSQVAALYRAGGLVPPPSHRIVIVPSPFVAMFAGGFAAAIWYRRQYGRRAATEAATEAATRAATREATGAATGAWWRCPSLAPLAQALFGPDAAFALSCARGIWDSCVQYGSEVSGYTGWLAWFRHVAQLPLDYSKWDAYERLARYNLRVLHPEFCLVVARPTRLLRDAENRPHCDDGPFCQWGDGTAYYAVHGVRVPWTLVEHPEQLTLAAIQQEQNAEVRRVMLDRFGLDRYLSESGALPVHADQTGTLYRCALENDEPICLVRVTNSTVEADGSSKSYTLRVPPTIQTAAEAVAWTFDRSITDYRPVIET